LQITQQKEVNKQRKMRGIQYRYGYLASSEQIIDEEGLRLSKQKV